MAAASTPVYDALFLAYLVIALIVATLVVGWLAVALFRFRDRGGSEPMDAPRAGVAPVPRGHPTWIYVMGGGIAVILFGLVFGTIEAVDQIEHPPESSTVYVNVTGFQFGWIFDYENGARSVNELRVPVNEVVRLNVTSRDVWHTFAIGDYRLRTDAIPGRVTQMWFEATQVGTARIECAELCGIGHATMVARVVAGTPEAFDEWLAGKAPVPRTNETVRTNESIPTNATTNETTEGTV